MSGFDGYAECRCAVCHYTECHVFVVILNFIEVSSLSLVSYFYYYVESKYIECHLSAVLCYCYVECHYAEYLVFIVMPISVMLNHYTECRCAVCH